MNDAATNPNKKDVKQLRDSKVSNRQSDRTIRYERRTVKETTPLRTQLYAKKPNTQTKQLQALTTQSDAKQPQTPTAQNQM
ncbi:3315_t:CDS:1, partial [Acaulospora morrowiae]